MNMLNVLYIGEMSFLDLYAQYLCVSHVET